jgi:outer membrane murein-binding lipoprotein Lpp
MFTKKSNGETEAVKTVADAGGDAAEAAASKKKTTKAATEVVTLKAICAELKMSTTEARVKLRAAGKRLRHAQGQPWEWSKGSPVIKEVKAS